MSLNKKLDEILHVYLYGEYLKLSQDPRYKKMTFELVVRALDANIEELEIGYLRQHLIADGYLKYNNLDNGEPMEITSKGTEFRLKSGYEKEEVARKLELEIKVKTLKGFKYSKQAIVISLFAIIIPTAISIYSLWVAKQPTAELLNLIGHSDSTDLKIRELNYSLDSIKATQSIFPSSQTDFKR